jgi:signal transduction histidine kinase
VTAKPENGFSTGSIRRRLPEVILALVAAILILIEIWVMDGDDRLIARSVAGIIAAGSLAFLRQRPFEAFLVNGFAIFALIALDEPSDFYQWTNLVALYGAAARVDTRRALFALGFSLAGVAAYFLQFQFEGGAVLAGFVVAMWTAGWFAGRAQLARTREVESQRERDLSRAELVAREARIELEAARNQIARDLHDVVGHAVNVMVVHAGAGHRALPDNPEQARTAFTTIGEVGRAALADLDRMLDVLEGQPERTPLPGLEQIDDLCRQVENSGMVVDYSLSGDATRVPSSLGITSYRIAQEALTNVVKHARARRVSVFVTVDHDLRLRVVDDGVGGPALPGRGLRGMEDRAALHGGTVSYGPTPDRGFELAARFPLEARA